MKKVFFLLFLFPLFLFSQPEEKQSFLFSPLNEEMTSWEIRQGEKVLIKFNKGRFRYIWKINWTDGQKGTLKPVSNNPNKFFFSLKKKKYLLTLQEDMEGTRWILKQQKPYIKTPYPALAAPDFKSWQGQKAPQIFKLVKDPVSSAFTLEFPTSIKTLPPSQVILPLIAVLYSHNLIR